MEWIRAGELNIESEPILANPTYENLPPIVQAYLRKVLPRSMTAVHHVRFRQSGFMALQQGPADKPFTAEQVIAIDRPAFSWTASLELAPLVKVQVCDRLVGPEGFLQARLAHVIPLARESGKDLLKGEVLRYLAELPWAPWGFLYLKDAAWAEVSPGLWQLSLTHGGASVRLLYQFDEQNLIASVRADDRPRALGKGSTVPTAWEGRFTDYADHEGILLPTKAEVSWLLTDRGETFTYFRGQIDGYTILP